MSLNDEWGIMQGLNQAAECLGQAGLSDLVLSTDFAQRPMVYSLALTLFQITPENVCRYKNAAEKLAAQAPMVKLSDRFRQELLNDTLNNQAKNNTLDK